MAAQLDANDKKSNANDGDARFGRCRAYKNTEGFTGGQWRVTSLHRLAPPSHIPSLGAQLSVDTAGATLKCLPREKSALREIITDLTCLLLINYRRPLKNLTIIKSHPEKSQLADNLPVKIRPARAAAGRGGFLPVNCRPGKETFFGGGSYNGTPEQRLRSVTDTVCSWKQLVDHAAAVHGSEKAVGRWR